MNITILLGCAVLLFALLTIVLLVFWSKRIIDRIHAQGGGCTVREMIKEGNGNGS